MRKIVISILVGSFVGSSIQLPAFAQVDPMPFMPKPGVMVHLSPEFSPAYLKGIVVHPEDPFKFDFIIYKGDKPLTNSQKKEEYVKLTKYFLASLAIPDNEQWVNLSPYEKDRIIKDDFGKTEMGRDLLAQDYMLKQITASLIYPEDKLGKEFWTKVYAQAQRQYGTTNIPVNTFNKVWILPDDALVYEKDNTAYVLKDHLRVMLEEDYLSLSKHSGIQSAPINRTHVIASKIVNEIVLPELEREVNEDKNFAPLRQVYSGMLLATWFKRTLKQSLLGAIYANKAKVKGVDQDPRTNEAIYRQYLKAYKKGVFNFIKEDVDKYTNQTIPRKYFSGGTASFAMAANYLGVSSVIHTVHLFNAAQMASVREELSTNTDLATIAMTKAIGAESKAMIIQSSPGAFSRRNFLKGAVLLIAVLASPKQTRAAPVEFPTQKYTFTELSDFQDFNENALYRLRDKNQRLQPITILCINVDDILPTTPRLMLYHDINDPEPKTRTYKEAIAHIKDLLGQNARVGGVSYSLDQMAKFYTHLKVLERTEGDQYAATGPEEQLLKYLLDEHLLAPSADGQVYTASEGKGSIILAPAKASVIQHEFNHAVFKLFPEYQSKVEAYFEGLEINIRNKVRVSLSFYNQDDFSEEFTAYFRDPEHNLRPDMRQKLQGVDLQDVKNRLRSIEAPYYQRLFAGISDRAMTIRPGRLLKAMSDYVDTLTKSVSNRSADVKEKIGQKVLSVREAMTRIKQRFGSRDNTVTIHLSGSQMEEDSWRHTEERDLDLVTRLLEGSNYLNDPEFDTRNRVFVRPLRGNFEEEKETFFLNVMETVLGTLERALQQEDPERVESSAGIFSKFIHFQEFYNRTTGIMTIKPVLKTGLENPFGQAQTNDILIDPEEFALLRSWNGAEQWIGSNIREISFSNGFKVVLEKLDESHVMIKPDVTGMPGRQERIQQLKELYEQKLATPMELAELVILNYTTPAIVSAQAFTAPWSELVVQWLKEQNNTMIEWLADYFRTIEDNPEFFNDEQDTAMTVNKHEGVGDRAMRTEASLPVLLGGLIGEQQLFREFDHTGFFSRRINHLRSWIQVIENFRVIDAEDQKKIKTRIKNLNKANVNLKEIMELLDKEQGRELLEKLVLDPDLPTTLQFGQVIAKCGLSIMKKLAENPLLFESTGVADFVDVVAKLARADPRVLDEAIEQARSDAGKLLHFEETGNLLQWDDLKRDDILFHGIRWSSIEEVIFEHGGFIDPSKRDTEHDHTFFSIAREFADNDLYTGAPGEGTVLEFDGGRLLDEGIDLKLGTIHHERTTPQPVPLRALTDESKRLLIKRFLSLNEPRNKKLAKALGFETVEQLREFAGVMKEEDAENMHFRDVIHQQFEQIAGNKELLGLPVFEALDLAIERALSVHHRDFDKVEPLLLQILDEASYKRKDKLAAFFNEQFKDEAMIGHDGDNMIKGGIDLNSANLAMLIKRDGRGVVLPIAQQDLAQLSNMEGLEPKVLSIVPVSQSPVFASLVGQP